MIDSISKYRLLDLCLLSVLAVFSEILGEVLHNQLSGAGYYLNFSILIAVIALIRWGFRGTVVYVIAGVAMLFMRDGQVFEIFLLYPFAYGFIGLTVFVLKLFKRENIRENSAALLLVTAVAHISVSIGKGLAVYILDGDFLKSMALYNITQIFSMIIVFIVLLIIKNRPGLLTDMEKYLKETAENA